MINKNFPNKVNGKKIIFNKHKNFVPELIPIISKETIKNSYVKKIDKPSDDIPDLIISDFMQKPINLCQNGFCLNLNIKDDEIGRGYCSSKCVIEHSKVLFINFMQNRIKYCMNVSSEKQNVLINNSPVKKLQTAKESKNCISPEKILKSDNTNILKADRKSIITQSKNESNVDCIEILDDDEPRESIFNIMYKKVFSNKSDKNFISKDSTKISPFKKPCIKSKVTAQETPKNNKRKVNDSDVIFVCEVKKSKTDKSKLGAVPEIIVID